MSERMVAYIEWVDSASTDGWHSSDDTPTPAKVKSVGWLVTETGTMLVITQSENFEAGHLPFSASLAIPKCSITSVRIVEAEKMFTVPDLTREEE